METLRFDALQAGDLEAALRLSTQAGWNQAAADWKRLLDLSPEGCIAGRLEGRLVATSTAAVYDGVAWIGMVLVDEAWRGRGWGRAVLEKAVERARELGARAVGLDATDLGRPVYLKMGFEDVAPIDRWGGVLREAGATGAGPIARDAILALDGAACGVDRRALLDHLLGEPGVAGWTAGRAGYAVLRPGREHAHLGPVVADDAAAFGALLDAAARHLRGATVFVDALRSDENSAVLSSQGLEAKRRLMRMTLPRAPLLMGPAVRAAAAFELG
jgi:GNAT superfamily N-acetyltransferase